MTWTAEKLIKNSVQFPIKRIYLKRRNISTGIYESVWQRIDKRNGINRVIKFGNLELKIDADKIIPNSYEISDFSFQLTNEDGYFNSNGDYRSFWSGYLDHKDTKIKIDIAMRNPDNMSEIGLITGFEGVLMEVVSKGDNTATFKCTDNSKKLNEFSFPELALTGTKTATEILTAIFASAKVTPYITSTEINPVQNVSIDITSNDKFTGTFWDVIKFLAERSMSTCYIWNNYFYFGTREVTSNDPIFTFAGLGNSQDDRAITIYGKPSYDQSGADKLYTKITESNSNLVANSSDPILLNEGRTLSLDLSDLNSTGEKQNVLDEYLARFGVRRPSLSFASPFMMFLLFPLDVIAVDSPGSKTEVNSGYYDSSLYDAGAVYDGDGGSSNIDKNARFILESISYNFDSWESKIFARKKI